MPFFRISPRTRRQKIGKKPSDTISNCLIPRDKIQVRLRAFDGRLGLRGDSLGGVSDLVLEVLGSLLGRAILKAASVQEDTGDLDDTDASEEEVHGGEAGIISQLGSPIKQCPGVVWAGEETRDVEGDLQNVTRLDDEAPSGPDGTGGHEGRVLGQGQLLSWTTEVGDTGDDESPLSIEAINVSLVLSFPWNRILLWSLKRGYRAIVKSVVTRYDSTERGHR